MCSREGCIAALTVKRNGGMTEPNLWVDLDLNFPKPSLPLYTKHHNGITSTTTTIRRSIKGEHGQAPPKLEPDHVERARGVLGAGVSRPLGRLFRTTETDRSGRQRQRCRLVSTS